MRQARPPVPTSADDLAPLGQDRADHGVGRRLPLRPVGQAQRLTHALFVEVQKKKSANQIVRAEKIVQRPVGHADDVLVRLTGEGFF